MRNINDMEISGGAYAPAPVSQRRIEDDYEDGGIDPYQEFYDYLIGSGTEASSAWDLVWENPARAAEIGWKLALNRQPAPVAFAA